MADERKLFELARAGEIDAIFQLAGGELEQDEAGEKDEGGGTADADDLAYKWLQVAADFGHQDADEAADDLLESSSLRCDDDHMVQGLIHLELGEQYLTGQGPLPVNFQHAQRHLEVAKQLAVHQTTDVAKGFDAVRRTLTAEAIALFDGVFPPKGKSTAAGRPRTKAKPAKTKGKARPGKAKTQASPK